ncbi:MAG: type II toxin-antitoxin system RelE/ParE family toxin [Magnetococcales bacterium]|nr:type II toxin-antitoxin system RelE/ParE family toxin [Magnetococcales bacterium]
MRYEILITRRAKRQLEKLTWRVQEKVAEGIARLGNDPFDQALDIKPLVNDPVAQYRLRVGSYRVKFNRDDGIRIVEIMRVGHRREIYQ